MGQKLPVKAWAIRHRTTGKLVIFDARCPVYWLRKVAVSEAQKRGFTVAGPDADVDVFAIVMKAV